MEKCKSFISRRNHVRIVKGRDGFAVEKTFVNEAADEKEASVYRLIKKQRSENR